MNWTAPTNLKKYHAFNAAAAAPLYLGPLQINVVEVDMLVVQLPDDSITKKVTLDPVDGSIFIKAEFEFLRGRGFFTQRFGRQLYNEPEGPDLLIREYELLVELALSRAIEKLPRVLSKVRREAAR